MGVVTRRIVFSFLYWSRYGETLSGFWDRSFRHVIHSREKLRYNGQVDDDYASALGDALGSMNSPNDNRIGSA